MKEKFEIVVKTITGLEEVLAEELKAIGAEDISILKRAVSCKGDNELMYKANYLCRTALRVLKPIAVFEVDDEKDLYDKISKIDWLKIINVDGTLAIDAVVNNSTLTHSQYVSLKTKDAIVDQFRDKFGKRPSVDLKHPDIRINIHISRNNCTVSLDSSGDSLHKRGYRKTLGIAPINEVLAAGLILLSEWDKKSDFVDPMCGSGTILIEAAMMANNIPAGYYRKFFGFTKWMDFDKKLWEKILDDNKFDDLSSEARIIGSDISPQAIAEARENLLNSELYTKIELKIAALKDLEPFENGGIMVCNPPYGVRVQTDDIIELYKEIGDALKQKFRGFNAFVISSDLRAIKFIGLKPSKKIIIFNGPLECRYNKFEIYQGSKKAKNK
ncbi:MAG: class I SAM-dependent RNA methyltransferase [Saprospiraceae bacterium]|nr:class I SAM-dependent RNA methyltransferase [Saprospiraceae bacterium]